MKHSITEMLDAVDKTLKGLERCYKMDIDLLRAKIGKLEAEIKLKTLQLIQLKEEELELLKADNDRD